MADIENLSSTQVAVTESRVDRTESNPSADGIPNVTEGASRGLHGLVLLGTGTPLKGSYCKIRVVVAATFSVFSGHNLDGTFTGVAFPVGFEIEGYFTQLSLSGGTVVVYKA